MNERTIAEYTREELDALRARLENGRDVLREGGALLQAVARGYYAVFATAAFVAGKRGVHATHNRRGKRVADQRFSHSELPPLIYALYSGNKKEAIQDVGIAPGIASGRYDASTAYRKADGLMRMRIEADYGPSSSPEPYDRAHIDEWLETANDLVRDLETLL
jgi:hypothetical protein